MGFSKTVEIGRVAYVAKGQDAGKLGAIIDVIDQNRGLFDGPKVRRQVVSFQNVHLTKYKIDVQHSARRKTVLKAWEVAKIDEQWKESNWAKKLERNEKKANLSDFDRYKLMRAKQTRNKIVRLELGKLKHQANVKKASAAGGKKPAAKGAKPAAAKKEVKPAAAAPKEVKAKPAAKEAKK
ncbi:putative 60S ribosomal protein L14 [Hypsibius exemplaris]|uniref:Large ribosomal subunit protein eL14 n=1 Tax=Hypsibius exemplaris TaxID=2072580 RepID=A0A1W0X483_HYPEX|nr:putative 60S ribosomal protein L14 [Hypsibius exemplaris]